MQIRPLQCGSLNGVEGKTRMTRELQKDNCIFLCSSYQHGSVINPEIRSISTEIRLHCFDKKHSPCLKLPCYVIGIEMFLKESFCLRQKHTSFVEKKQH